MCRNSTVVRTCRLSIYNYTIMSQSGVFFEKQQPEFPMAEIPNAASKCGHWEGGDIRLFFVGGCVWLVDFHLDR